MEIKVLLLTPEIAGEWLAKNTSNRPVNRLHVQHLTREIREGRWKLNGDTIVFSRDRLIDGQHRLMAIVEAGVAVESAVVFGVADDVFDTKDVGKKRTGADTLAVRGEKNCTWLSACLSFISRYENGTMGSWNKITNSQIHAVLAKHPKARESVEFVRSIKLESILVGSVATGCHYLFSTKDRQLADWFFLRLSDGLGISNLDPVYILRQRLITERSSKSVAKPVYLAGLVIKAWNATRRKQVVHLLKMVSGEEFPVVE